MWGGEVEGGYNWEGVKEWSRGNGIILFQLKYFKK